MVEIPPASDQTGELRMGAVCALARERSAAIPRVLGRQGGTETGPTLACIVGLHGNEPAGIEAVERVLDRLRLDGGGLRGGMVGLAGNRGALRQRSRYQSVDLNRLWVEREISSALGSAASAHSEARELEELFLELEVTLQAARGEMAILDLHTFSGPGPPFVILNDTMENRALARPFPVPLVLGLEEALSGTLTSYWTARGFRTVTFEAGRHRDPRSVDRAEAAIWITLEALGILSGGTREEVRSARRLLAAEVGKAPSVVEVLRRHPVSPGDGFCMLSGFRSFQPVGAGDILARDLHGDVRAGETGFLLMPLYQAQGEDGFYIAKPVRSIWLAISAALQSLGCERFLRRLPGVEPDPDLEEGFIVDRSRARWFALEIFHLLGFQKREERGGLLFVERRRRSGR